MNALAAIVQVADFLYKAIIAFAKTEEGMKELADVERALGLDVQPSEITLSEEDETQQEAQNSSAPRVYRRNSGG